MIRMHWNYDFNNWLIENVSNTEYYEAFCENS